MSTYIVTGAAGLIGSNLVRALNARGEQTILGVDHLNHPLKQRNLDALQLAEYLDKATFLERIVQDRIPPPATLFHLGACSATTETDAEYLHRNNTAYTETLCRWALRHGVRFVYASSAATYGDGRHGYSDADPITPRLEPLNAYGRSKQAFDRQALGEGWLRRIAGLKYFNVFGPGEDHKGDMRSLIRKAFDEIRATGELRLFRSHRPDCRDGEQHRDFLYVLDAVQATLFFHDQPGVAGLFNCGTGRARSWNDLGAAIFAALEQPVSIRYVDMPPTLRDHYQYHTEADLAKLRTAGYDAVCRPLESTVGDYIRHLLATTGTAD